MVDLKNERIQLRALENLFAQKRFSEALTFAEKLLGDYPNSYHIGFINVKILKELNRLREAEAEALKLMHLSPGNINLLLELGTICLKLNKYDESYDYYNKVLFLDPFNNEARDSMDKIKGLKKVSGEGEQKEKKLIDFIAHPRSDKDKEDTAPELEEDQISPLSLGVEFESIEPGKAADESLEFVEPFEPIEQAESIESPDQNEPGEVISQIPITTVPAADVVEAPEITEIEGMAEIPEVVDVAEEVDTIGTQTIDPYAEFYNGETVESVEETAPVEEEVMQMPENTPITSMEEPGDAAEFVTESAADLYLTQGLYDDALRIYEKLYATQREGRFLLKVKQLRAHKAGREKIRRLDEFLKLIQMKGE
ncbi:MAG TPA: hypothetical protein VK469_18995 [Candidatus Kapabacteria bacterium]|nr:hypothetical protein [Candidatus Kapabacteria bacterium]